jgi:hypothetical protein
MLKGRIDVTNATLDSFVSVLIWSAVIALTTLASLAISDYSRQEAERLQRVHTQGMALGAKLCAKDGQ